MLTAAPPSCNITGLSDDEPVRAFWTWWGTSLPKYKEVMDRIADIVEEEHALPNWVAQFSMWDHDFRAIIIDNGGKAAWLRTMESVSGFTFRKLAPGAPQSAEYALSNQQRTVHKPRYEEESKVGQDMLAEGTLDAFRLDLDRACGQ